MQPKRLMQKQPEQQISALQKRLITNGRITQPGSITLIFA
jgi:hypothetical protein